MKFGIMLLAASVGLASVSFGETIVNSTWVGVDDSHSAPWHTANLWNPQSIPENDANFVYNVTIGEDGNSARGPSLEAPITLNNLTLQNTIGMSNNHGAPADLTVLGTTTDVPLQFNGEDHYGGWEIRVSTYTLGTFTNFSANTLNAGYFRIESGVQPAVLQFKGADVIESKAYLELSGPDSFIKDQDNGLDGLRNFATNSGGLELSLGRQLATAGDFTSNASIFLTSSKIGDPNTPSKLTVNGKFTNNASLDIRAGAKMLVTGDMDNAGDIDLDGEGSELTVNGNLTQTAGALTLGGDTGQIETFKMTAKRIDLAAGTTFGGRGTLLCDLVEGGIFAPGNSPGKIAVQGDITFQSTATFDIELGGTTPDTGYDQVAQQTQPNGAGVTLAGLLSISFVNNFATTVSPSDVFTILDSDHPLAGAFSNVASGARLLTSDGLGSFLVTYSGQDVVLSQYQSVPEPTAIAALASATALSGCRLRRRR